MLRLPGILAGCLLFYTAIAQPSEESKAPSPRRLFLSWQPLVLLEPQAGGIKTGLEHTLNSRHSVALDLGWRFITYAGQELEPGESDRRRGFQIQPEYRFYLGVRPGSTWINERAFRNSLSVRFGYSQLNTDIRFWSTVTDGSGNLVEKILAYTRRQQFSDITVLLNRKFYFDRESRGWGLEAFFGMGVRRKQIDYLNLSPELDAAELRRQDENRLFSLMRNGYFWLLPAGIRVFYLFP